MAIQIRSLFYPAFFSLLEQHLPKLKPCYPREDTKHFHQPKQKDSVRKAEINQFFSPNLILICQKAATNLYVLLKKLVLSDSQVHWTVRLSTHGKQLCLFYPRSKYCVHHFQFFQHKFLIFFPVDR